MSKKIEKRCKNPNNSFVQATNKDHNQYKWNSDVSTRNRFYMGLLPAELILKSAETKKQKKKRQLLKRNS